MPPQWDDALFADTANCPLDTGRHISCAANSHSHATCAADTSSQSFHFRCEEERAPRVFPRAEKEAADTPSRRQPDARIA